MINSYATLNIGDAIENEKKAAIAKYGTFHNNHEAWAVLREEIQETLETFAAFDSVTESEMENLWAMTRSDHIDKESILNIYNSSMETVEECIQVLAMCMKWIDLLNESVVYCCDDRKIDCVPDSEKTWVKEGRVISV